MYPATFEYHRASSLDDALALLAQYGDDGKLIAGGHSLLPVMKLRFAQPAHLIDIRRIAELAGIREEGGVLRIGATTPHAAVAASGLSHDKAVALALGGGLRVVGRGGPRTIPLDQFFTGMFSAALAPDELLVEVRVPVAPA